MSHPAAHEITTLLSELQAGRSYAAGELLPLVYHDLRRLAEHFLRQERADHTLQPTALVHESYLRLVDHTGRNWNNRAHFFAVAAQAMRRILIDHARSRRSEKRGGQQQKLPLDDRQAPAELPSEYVLALNEAIEKLATIDEQAARVVELRFFGGLTVEEIAQVLGVSARTVKRDWRTAKTWLHREISQAESR